MQIGTGPAPGDGPHQQSTHWIYDVRSGAIVATYHFSGAAAKSAEEQHASLLKASRDASGIALDHLAVLSNPELPPGDGELHVEPATRRFVRKGPAKDLRLRP